MQIGNLPHIKTFIRFVSALKVEILFATIFTFILTSGYLLSTHTTIDLIPVIKRKVLVYFFGSLVLWGMLLFALVTLKQWGRRRANLPRAASYLASISDNKLWALTTVAIFGCYLPILLTSLSMLSPDSWNSIGQATGAIPLSNGNPLIFTAFVAIFVDLGRLFADIELGTVFFSFAQSAILAIIFARVIVWMRRENVGRVGIVSTFLFYAILPINSIAGLIMWKDILFAGFGILFLMVLRQLYMERDGFFTTKKVTYFMILAFLFCTWRNNGLYAYGLFVVLTLIIERKTVFSKKYLLLLFAPIILTGVYLGAITFITTPTSTQAATMIVPAQQIARTVKYESGSITPSERKIINQILPYDRLGEEYNPRLSDPVMGSFNATAFRKHEGRYFGVWFKLFENHKRTYIASFLYNSYGYVYPFYTSSTPTDILLDNANHPNALKGYTDTAYKDGGKFLTVDYRDLIMNQAPILQNVGFYTCIVILGAYIAIVRKRRELLGVFVILFGLFVSTILGPVNGEFRYLYLFVVACPFILVAAFSDYSPALRMRKKKRA